MNNLQTLNAFKNVQSVVEDIKIEQQELSQHETEEEKINKLKITNSLDKINQIANSKSISSSNSNSSLHKQNSEIAQEGLSDRLEDSEEDFYKVIKGLTEEELGEYEEYCDYLFQEKFGNHLTIDTLHKIFIRIKPNDRTLNEEQAGIFINTLFTNFKKQYTLQEKEDLQKKYPFNCKPYSNQEGALYELHEIYNVNQSILEKKSLSMQFKDIKSFESKLIISRIPYEVLKYTQEYFSQSNSLYKPYIEKELKGFHQNKYNIFK